MKALKPPKPDKSGGFEQELYGYNEARYSSWAHFTSYKIGFTRPTATGPCSGANLLSQTLLVMAVPLR